MIMYVGIARGVSHPVTYESEGSFVSADMQWGQSFLCST